MCLPIAEKYFSGQYWEHISTFNIFNGMIFLCRNKLTFITFTSGSGRAGCMGHGTPILWQTTQHRCDRVRQTSIWRHFFPLLLYIKNNIGKKLSYFVILLLFCKRTLLLFKHNPSVQNSATFPKLLVKSSKKVVFLSEISSK